MMALQSTVLGLIGLLLLISYLLYPLFMALAGVRADKRSPAQAPAQVRPSATLLLAAYNEEAHIAARLDNLLQQDYPEDQLAIVVISDGSTDQTATIARGYAGRMPRISVIESPGRLGKNACLNLAARQAQGQVLVFTDCNSIFLPDAISQLIKALAEPGMGCVSGVEKALTPRKQDRQTGLYGKYETATKAGESSLGCFFSGNGSIMAVWRQFYRDLPPDQPNDLYTLLSVISAGQRCRLVSRAVALEQPGVSLAREVQRKRRIVSRAVSCVRAAWPRLPLRVKLALAVHKIVRWVALPLGVIAWALSISLILGSALPAALALATLLPLLVLAAAILNHGRHLLPGMLDSLLRSCLYVAAVHYGAAAGVWDGLRKGGAVTWAPSR